MPFLRALALRHPLAARPPQPRTLATTVAAIPPWAAAARAVAPSAFMPDEEGRDWAEPTPSPSSSTTPSTSPLPPGTLLAVKDTFDIAGQATGFGSPAWRAAHPPARSTAAAVAALLAAGARMVGRTICDELTYGLEGENPHFGSPANPAAPGRVTGGSSAGSAAAVASGAVPLALGSDTGGSVRLPASYCGVFGFRPTHGRVSLAGACALAPSYDTAGWFAADAGLLRAAGRVLLGPPPPGLRTRLDRWLVAADAFDLASPETAAALFGPVAAAKEGLLGSVFTASASPEEVCIGSCLEGGLPAAADAFRVTQAAEITATLGPWLAAARPALGPVVADRLAWAAAVSDAQARAGDAARATVRSTWRVSWAPTASSCCPPPQAPRPGRATKRPASAWPPWP